MELRKQETSERTTTLKDKIVMYQAPFFWAKAFFYEGMPLFKIFANIAQIVNASFMTLSASAR